MLIIHKDPAGVMGRDIYELDLTRSLQDNIAVYFPRGLDALTTTIRLNGVVIDPLTYNLSRPATALDRIDLVLRPQGFDPYTLAIYAAIAIAAALAVTVLMPTPTIPNGVGGNKTSPNNSLTGQTNVARLYQAKPDAYGRNRMFADLIQDHLYYYDNNIKYVDEWMCLGSGEYEIRATKFNDTPLISIAGSSAVYYNPGETIPRIITGFRFPEVDGQKILGPNEEVSDADYSAETANVDSIEFAADTLRINIVRDEVFEGFFTAIKPFPVVITMNFQYEKFVAGVVERVTEQAQVSAVLTEASETDDADPLFPTEFYSFTFSEVTYPTGIPANAIILDDFLKLTRPISRVVGPFISAQAADQFWLHILAQLGKKEYAELTVEFWKVNRDNDEIPGTREIHVIERIYNTGEYDTFYKTLKFTPAAGFGLYAMQIKRTNNSNSTSVSRLEGIHSIRIRENVVHPHDTILNVRMEATIQATSYRDLKINCIATRKTISYDRVNRKISYALTPSRSFADAVLHSYVIVAGRSPNDLDLDEIYRIADSVKEQDPRLQYFDFTFDDKDISLGQRLQTICNAARVAVYRDGQKWRFVRDEYRPAPVAQFDRRNLASGEDGGTLSYRGQLPSSYDGIELEYVDATDNNEDGTDRKAYIRLRIKPDGSIDEGYSNRPSKIELAGCRNRYQAMNRAQLEARKLLYQRRAVSDEALSDANFVQFGDWVRWVDAYDEEVSSGEIVRIEGAIYYTSERLSFLDGETYRVSITDRSGYPSEWVIAKPVPGNNQAFSAEISGAYVADNIIVQCGSRYVIAVEKELEALNFTLTDKSPSENGNIAISLVAYDPRTYEYDTVS